MADRQAEVAFGLRHDPLVWASSATGLQPVLIRRVLGMEPLEGDDAAVQDEIDSTLATITPNNTFDDDHRWNASAMVRLVELGLSPEHEALQRAGKALLKRVEAAAAPGSGLKEVHIFELAALCVLGMRDEQVVKGLLKKYVTTDDWLRVWSNPNQDCGWTSALWWWSLSVVLDMPEVRDAVRTSLSAILEETEPYGHRHHIAFGFLQGLGYVDLPEAKALLERLLPLVIRSQHADGSWSSEWGTHGTSFGTALDVLRSLHTHSLLEPLRNAAPLPPDWTTLRTFDAPGEAAAFLVPDGATLWVYSDEDRRAFQISVDDGSVLKTVSFPSDMEKTTNLRSVAVWDDCFVTAQWNPPLLRLIDKKSGKVRNDLDLCHLVQRLSSAVPHGDELRITTGFEGIVLKLQKGSTAPEKVHDAGKQSFGSQAVDWYYNPPSDLFMLGGPNGELQDWAENPFDTQKVSILTLNGEQYVLDGEKRQIAVMTRASVEG